MVGRLRFGWITALLVACGGGGDDADDADGTGNTTEPQVLECELPQYDLSSLSCDQLAAAWRDTVEAGNDCNTAADCVVLRAPCESWYQVECYYATRASCVDAGDLSAFAAEATGCNTVGDSCICSGDTPVDCVSGECVIVSSQ